MAPAASPSFFGLSRFCRQTRQRQWHSTEPPVRRSGRHRQLPADEDRSSGGTERWTAVRSPPHLPPLLPILLLPRPPAARRLPVSAAAGFALRIRLALGRLLRVSGGLRLWIRRGQGRLAKEAGGRVSSCSFPTSSRLRSGGRPEARRRLRSPEARERTPLAVHAGAQQAVLHAHRAVAKGQLPSCLPRAGRRRLAVPLQSGGAWHSTRVCPQGSGCQGPSQWAGSQTPLSPSHSFHERQGSSLKQPHRALRRGATARWCTKDEWMRRMGVARSGSASASTPLRGQLLAQSSPFAARQMRATRTPQDP